MAKTAAKAASGAIGKVAIIYGDVKAISPDGTVRILGPNSPVFADDQIITGGDGSVSLILDGTPPIHLDLGRMSQITLDEDVYGGPASAADAAAQAEQAQQAILAGEQPIEPEAPAAGGEASSGGGHPVVNYSLTGAEVTPDSGAETRGIGFAPLEVTEGDTAPIGGDDIGAVDDEGIKECRIRGNLGGPDDGSDHPTNDAFIVGNLSYNFGADGPHPTEPFAWSMAGLEDMNIMSHGHELRYEVVDGGTTLNAYYIIECGGSVIANSLTKEGPNNSEQIEFRVEVFSLELTNVDTGAYKFTLFKPLDHPLADTEDDINYIFGYGMKDGDGSSGSGVLRMTVDDDSPIVKEYRYENRTVDEDDINTCLSDGNWPNDGDRYDGSFTGNPWNGHDYGPANIWGSLAGLVRFGADGPDKCDAFSFLMDDEGKYDLESLTEQKLASHGDPLNYRIDGNTLIGYVGDYCDNDNGDPQPAGTRVLDSQEYRKVFTLELDGDGDYKFSLYDQLDHVELEDDETGDEGRSSENCEGRDTNIPIDFSGIIVATDYDGDSVTLTEGKFVINITDDEPTCASYDIVITEDEQNAHHGGINETWDVISVFPYLAKLSGSVGGTVEDDARWGADGFGGVNEFIVDGEHFEPCTTVYWDKYGNFLGTDEPEDSGIKTASAETLTEQEPPEPPESDHAASLTVDEFGNYTFTLLSNMLMGQGEQGEQTDYLDTVQVIGRDWDGDEATIDLYLKVDDDVPCVELSRTGCEDRVTLTTQDAETRGDCYDTDSSNFSHLFAITSVNYGADGPGGCPSMSYELNLANWCVKDSGLKCDEAKINLYKIGNDIVGSTASSKYGVTDGNTVFTLKVDSTGTVTLTQFKEIDHSYDGDTGPVYDDQLRCLSNNLVDLTATASVVDGDGDVATSCETIDLGGNIRFADDGPKTLPNADVVMDDDDVVGAHGNPGGINDDVAPVLASGTLGHDFGADGAGSVGFSNLDGQTGIVGMEMVKFTWIGDTLTAKVTAGDAARIGTTLFTVKVNPTTGDYEVKQLDNVIHGDTTVKINTGNYLLNEDIVKIAVGVTHDGLDDVVIGSHSSALFTSPDGYGFGVTMDGDGGDGGRYNELNHIEDDSCNESEVIIFSLQGERMASEAKVDFTYFYKNEANVGNEIGQYALYNNGIQVKGPTNFTANSTAGNFSLDIACAAGFDEIRFMALRGSDDSSRVDDSSDYYVKCVEFKDVTDENNTLVDLTYLVKDEEGDKAYGTLTVNFDDDTPVALNQHAHYNVLDNTVVETIVVNTGNTDSNGLGGPHGNDVRITVYAPYDSNASLNETDDGNGTAFGINSKYDEGGNREDEINYLDNYGKSEYMTFELQNDHGEVAAGKIASSATVLLSEFYPNEDMNGNGTPDSNEVGAYQLFRDGDLVQDWTSFMANSADGKYTLNITSPDKFGFDSIRFKGIQGQYDTSSGDSSDFNVKQITFNLVADKESGNLLTGSDPDGSFGADGGHVASIASECGIDSSISTTAGDYDLKVKGELGGWLEVKSDTGDYLYTPPTDLPCKDATEKFSFTLIDGDGDMTSAELNMCLDVPDKEIG